MNSPLDYVFQSEALVDLERFRVIVFQWSAKNDNSKCSLPSMIPNVKVEFRVAISGYREKNNHSELGIFTCKHYSTCHRKIPGYHFNV